jgi:thioester reductase-like protein
VTGLAREDILRRALIELKDAHERLASLEREREPAAVVGVGCRFPGADGPDAYWQLLCEGRDAVVEVPPERWDVDAYYDVDPGVAGKTYSRHAGLLEGVDLFDAALFGITPREAAAMDPQHRIVLEVAWSALEHAGIAPDSLHGKPVGVFIGLTATDYAHVAALEGGIEAVDAYLGTGNAPNFAAGRLSYVLGLCGPSLVLDTACSSALVAVHTACRSLAAGECELAIAGGVNLLLLPETTVALSKARMLSPSGRCHTFDAAADGYVRGEGCGLLVLERASDARAAGRQVLAEIRGTAVNHDGRSSGVTVPYAAAQQAVIERALAAAKITPEQVDFVEAHGTGTPLGDPIEVRALARVFGRDRAPDRPLLLGSVKTNIGHLESAAGAAGLIKAVLALAHRELPPQLHLSEPNPHLDWAALPVRVVTERTPLAAQRPVAGVSSFGISGTNAHVVVQAAESVDRLAAKETAPGPALVKVAAHDEPALLATAERLASFVEELPDTELAAVAHTADTGRADLPERLSVVAGSVAELAAGLRTGGTRGHVTAGRLPRVAFLATGQGVRYDGVLETLDRDEPAVSRLVDRLAEVLGPRDQLPLAALLEPGVDAVDALARTEVAQPALYALALAQAARWQAAGVEPAALLGHSVGAYAAAALAGVFDFETGAHIVTVRGRLMGALPAGGAMAAVFASEHDVRGSLGEGVEIAAVNAVDEIVVSGRRAPLDELCARLAAAGVRSAKLAVSHAFHSAEIEPALAAFGQALATFELAPPRLTLVSDLTGAPVTEEAATPDYWLAHARRPVRFADAAATLDGLGCGVLVEVGPAATLLELTRRSAPDAVLLPSRRPPRADREVFLESLGRAWTSGVELDWQAIAPGSGLRLPGYAFQRRRHWVRSDRKTRRLGEAARRLVSEHVIEGVPVVPGVIYLDALLDAATEAGIADGVVESLELQRPLVGSGDVGLEVVVEAGEGARTARVFSHGRDGRVLHAQATVAPRLHEPLGPPVALDELRNRFGEPLTGERFYEVIWHPEFRLGDSFRLVESVARIDGEAFGFVRGAPAVGVRPELLVLDACVQLLSAAAPSPLLRVGAGHAHVRTTGDIPANGVWCHAVAGEHRDGTVEGELRVYAEDGTPVAEIDGVRLAAIPAGALGRSVAPHRPARPRPELEGLEADALRDTVAAYLANALGDVLGIEPVELDLEQPLTALADSLMLAELRAQIETGLGVEVPISTLFEEPTLAGLGAWIAARVSGESLAAAPTVMTVAELEREATLDDDVRPRPTGPGRQSGAVFLTGATGFVGAFVLDALLEATDADVYCLVRAESAQAARERIDASLARYDLGAVAESRIVPVVGDLIAPRLGLGDRFHALSARVDAIYHCAAAVNWTYPYSALAAANVDGTRRVLELATAGAPLPVHFVSTVGVFASQGSAGRTVSEADALATSGPLAVGYAQTKWVAERLVRIAGERGLPVSVYRPSTGGDSRTGAFNARDHLTLILGAAIELGCAPESDLPVQIAPVDVVARSLVELSLRRPPGGTFHLVGRDVLTWAELFDLVRECGYLLDRAEPAVWLERVADAGRNGQARSLSALLPFLRDALAVSALPRFDRAGTDAALAGSGIELPPLDARLLDLYLRRFVATGFIAPTTRAAAVATRTEVE